VQLGQELDFRILRIDPENKKIGLSARAATSDEHAVDTKTYSTEVKGGMASLSELADFFSPSASSQAEPNEEEDQEK
jgi:ribosomal protein S1